MKLPSPMRTRRAGLTLFAGVALLFALLHALFIGHGPHARWAAAVVAAGFALLPVGGFAKLGTMLIGAAFFGAAYDHLFVPFASDGATLLSVAAARPVWALAGFGLAVAFVLRIEAVDREGADFSPPFLFASCTAAGLAFVAVLESGLAAFSSPTTGTVAVLLHAFAAETAVHAMILILWFGLTFGLVTIHAPAPRARMEEIARLLPLLGFVGTVIGLSVAISAMAVELSGARDVGRDALEPLFRGLAVKFETSLLGLAASIATSLVGALVRRAEDDHG